MTKLIHRSGGEEDWRTPQFLFDYFNDFLMFEFELDAAASDENHLCEKYFTKETDALKHPWASSTFVNPPYSPHVLQKKFIHKAVTEACQEKTVVCLIPSRTETKIWQEFVFPLASAIYFLDERIHFSYHENAAGFPSAVVLFDSKANKNITMKTAGHVPGEVVTLSLKSMPGYADYRDRIKENQEFEKFLQQCSPVSEEQMNKVKELTKGVILNGFDQDSFESEHPDYIFEFDQRF